MGPAPVAAVLALLVLLPPASARPTAMSELGVRRGKAAFFSGCKSHPATIAPAGSNRSSHGGGEMAEAFGIACHESVSLDFRVGSPSDHRRHHQEGLFLGVKQT